MKNQFNIVGERIFKHCEKCYSYFSSTFRERTHCVKCVPTTKKELGQLLNFEGGKIVQIAPNGAQKLVT